MARFNDLPDELQLRIFELTCASEFRPRTVELYFKAGEIYSKTLPPPLLHVCQLSRWVVLKFYKPWLPEFKGKPWHKPYKHLIEKHGGVEKLSRLNNVCISLESDLLLVNKQQSSEWNFGYLEKQQLKNFAVNLNGWINWSAAMDLLQQFTNLCQASIFDNDKHNRMVHLKVGQIQSWAITAENRRPRKYPSYTAPLIKIQDIPEALAWDRDTKDWITYKYPKDYRSDGRNHGLERNKISERFSEFLGGVQFIEGNRDEQMAPNPQPSPRSRKENMSGILANASPSTGIYLPLTFSGDSNSASKGTTLNRTPLRSVSTNASISRISIKRKLPEEFDKEVCLLEQRKGGRVSAHSMVERSVKPIGTQPLIEDGASNDDLRCLSRVPTVDDWEQAILPSNRIPFGEVDSFNYHGESLDISPARVLQDCPARANKSKKAWEIASEETFADIFDCLRTPSPEPSTHSLISSPLDLNSTFSGTPTVFEEIGTPVSSHGAISPLNGRDRIITFADPRPAIYDLYDDALPFNSSAVGEHLIYTGEQDPSYLDPRNVSPIFKKSTALGVESTIQPSLIYDNTSFHADSDYARLSTSLPNDSLPVLESQEIMVTMQEKQDLEAVPECLIAESLVLAESQCLVQSNDNPQDSRMSKDFVLRTAPDLMMEWNVKKSATRKLRNRSQVKIPVLEYVVEKILGKKKFNGTPHYLVKWEGYPLVKDRTWEPYDRLTEDVPTLVENYEASKRKRKKRS